MLRDWKTHSLIEENPKYESRWRKNPSPTLREPNENEILIQHVGDGEYQFNVFGAAYTSWGNFFNNAIRAFPKYQLAYYYKGKIVWIFRFIPEFGYWDSIAKISYEPLNPAKFHHGW